MSEAVASSMGIVAYLALFVGVGFAFLFANLLVGRFVRPSDPHEEKLEIYECGEPTIGSGFVQFDLRFYVVALLFIIFDVEIAFFFPWATVFGKAVTMSQVEQVEDNRVHVEHLYREMGVGESGVPSDGIAEGARVFALLTIVDIAVFFAVLIVGFLYVWKRGDLDWVRAVTQHEPAHVSAGSRESASPEPAISA